MSNVQFNLVRRGDSANITVVVDGDLYVADDQHPAFNKIVEAAVAGNESVVDLFDASKAAGVKFESLSDRVTVSNSRVYVGGVEVDDVFAQQIVRFLEADVDDWEPLVNFLEKVYSNVEEDVRENLSRWLKAEAFTILPNGNILGYRGLNSDYTSKHAGPGIVNGVRQNGHLDNSVGNVVEMERNMVTHDPRQGCAPGLHVGTSEYARSWGSTVVEVSVDPRDVVSVPYECSSQKMRVSKYVVLRDSAQKFSAPVYDDYEDYDEDEDDYYDEYGYDY